VKNPNKPKTYEKLIKLGADVPCIQFKCPINQITSHRRC